MTPGSNALTALRIALGVMLVVLSVGTFLHPGGHGHVELLVRMVALAEIAGAILLLLPWTVRIGAAVLLAVIAVAVSIHFLHGQWNVAPLVIYAAATQVFLRSPGPRAAR